MSSEERRTVISEELWPYNTLVHQTLLLECQHRGDSGRQSQQAEQRDDPPEHTLSALEIGGAVHDQTVKILTDPEFSGIRPPDPIVLLRQFRRI